MVRKVYVNCNMDWTTVFKVQEGDVVNITATGNSHFGGLFGSAGTSGPRGRSGDNAPANDNWPLPGVPKFSLIGSIGPTAFFVGVSASITINRDGGPFTLMLGPNDNVVGDNNGAFDVVAVLYR